MIVEEDGAIGQEPVEILGQATFEISAPSPGLGGLRIVGEGLGHAGEASPSLFEGPFPLLVSTVVFGLARDAGAGGQPLWKDLT